MIMIFHLLNGAAIHPLILSVAFKTVFNPRIQGEIVYCKFALNANGKIIKEPND